MVHMPPNLATEELPLILVLKSMQIIIHGDAFPSL